MNFSILVYSRDSGEEALSGSDRMTVPEVDRLLRPQPEKRGGLSGARQMPSSDAVRPVTSAAPVAEPARTDGPVVTARERLTGVYAAEFTDLDEAVRFAALMAAPRTRLEIRAHSPTRGVAI